MTTCTVPGPPRNYLNESPEAPRTNATKICPDEEVIVMTVGTLRDRFEETALPHHDDDFDQLALVPGQMPDPEEEVLRQLDRDELRRALAQLPETFRTAIVLVELQGLSCEEAAEVMGTPRGTVLSRLYRGRARLRQILEKVPA